MTDPFDALTSGLHFTKVDGLDWLVWVGERHRVTVVNIGITSVILTRRDDGEVLDVCTGSRRAMADIATTWVKRFR
nr:hypothetical protein [Kibdelosporangium sp. MJ126-NF4]CEL17618.1 hypothetical protein [Kibdelosporangium sp. MJ126-NF4]